MTSSSFVTLVILMLVTALVTWLFFRSKIEGLGAQVTAREGELAQTRSSLEQTTSVVSDLQTQLLAARTDQAALTERLKAERESMERERAVFENAKASLADTFRSIGAEVLDRNSAKVAEIARGVLAAENAETKGSLDLKEQAIQNIVGPVKDQLDRLQSAVGEMERKREGAYGELTSRVEALIRTESELQRETSHLNSNTATLMQALKGSGSRGRWGEFTLQRVVEMAGMTEHCEYDVQPAVNPQEGDTRPDMIVHLPGGSFVVIDAKVPMAAYIDSMEAGDDLSRSLKSAEHARGVRAHVEVLSKRSYVRPDLGSPDFVIMFVPGEGILSSSFHEDPDLLEYAYSRKVLFATPTNLIAMLRTIALSWKHKALEEDATEIAREGGELYERLAKCGKYIMEMGNSLNKTVTSYNEMVGNIEGRVLTTGRRLRDRAITLKRGDEIPQPQPIETSPRQLTAPEFVTFDQDEAPAARELAPAAAGSSNGTNGTARTSNSPVSSLLSILGILPK
ncbi:MAG TPA: DNA recombination protein RmuC [Candidatus Baltobacteraceae bacterium]|nr:DNA recombination protein RmuC [Candidatus Baltobacteraceae bacterium]